jgi:hypothetical protein
MAQRLNKYRKNSGKYEMTVSIDWNKVGAKTELGKALGLYPALVHCLHPTAIDSTRCTTSIFPSIPSISTELAVFIDDFVDAASAEPDFRGSALRGPPFRRSIEMIRFLCRLSTRIWALCSQLP